MDEMDKAYQDLLRDWWFWLSGVLTGAVLVGLVWLLVSVLRAQS